MHSPRAEIRITLPSASPPGLMELMNDDELEGVIAHELSHVRNYDILTTSIAATLAGAITWIAEIAHWGMIFGGFGGGSRDNRRRRQRQPDDDLPGAARRAVYPAWHFPPAGISGRRLRRPLVGHPYGLISALEKLGAYNKKIPMQISQSTAALCIVAPLQARQMFANLFSTHPPLDDRIEILKHMQITR